jgi:phosphonate utilization associated putative membrane protein
MPCVKSDRVPSRFVFDHPFMTLSWTVVCAVLLGAFLHASWNALVKSSTDKELDMALLPLIGSLWAIPVLAWLGWPQDAAWPFIIASTIIHTGYYATIVGAYRHGDLSLTYPLMRGAAPLLVALVTHFAFGESLSPVAWAGVASISAGVLALGLNARALQAPKAVAFALTNAMIIACYTVVDGMGVRASGNAPQYIGALFLLHGWPFALLVFYARGNALVRYAKHRWPVATLGSGATMASYGIALWAMTRAPVAMVAALRETSVLFAVFLGVFLLRETVSRRRVIGAFIIVCGVIGVRVG